jgi:hypothetical protein
MVCYDKFNLEALICTVEMPRQVKENKSKIINFVRPKKKLNVSSKKL